MPILDVQVVGDVAESIRAQLARRIADAAADVLNSRPQGTWVKVQVLPERDYAENAGGPEPGVRPVFVAVQLREPPAGLALQAQVTALTAAIAEACGRPPENVHLQYHPPAPGRVFFGGT